MYVCMGLCFFLLNLSWIKNIKIVLFFILLSNLIFMYFIYIVEVVVVVLEVNSVAFNIGLTLNIYELYIFSFKC